ncbi:hypothetical protein Rhow_000916 [Rhodococcus wratislaviensis]|uniref:Uncharacterized protein n=1 Tax=Rhodococcus wratislaviensis TaxID=44752 RepID=A0A402C3A1_RHOWR|nr:hypothetical protein [Rhodococcus wratislaviensis]GCE38032.1 hypothetical protein Rhow_000916 [Rhodococcus wratislaviensis]
MHELDNSIQAQLHDLGYVHAVTAEIRRVAAALAVNPLDEEASTSLWLLVFIEAPAARAALSRACALDIADSVPDCTTSDPTTEAGIR